MEEMLVCSGRLGYAGASVDLLCHQSGVPQDHFYDHFESKAACFHSAYEMGSERLSGRLLEASGQGCDLRQALDHIAEFIVAEPMQARALFIEVHAAAGASLDKRFECMERFAHLLDNAYRTKDCMASEMTSCFVVYTIDHIVRSSLAHGRAEEFNQQVPVLVALVEGVYGMDTQRRLTAAGHVE